MEPVCRYLVDSASDFSLSLAGFLWLACRLRSLPRQRNSMANRTLDASWRTQRLPVHHHAG